MSRRGPVRAENSRTEGLDESPMGLLGDSNPEAPMRPRALKRNVCIRGPGGCFGSL
jgi:hypothetical protein